MPVSTRLSQVSTAENLRDRKLEGQTPRKAHFSRFCVSPRRQRSRHHCRQLGNLLRVAGDVGSDAATETVDGRAKAMLLDVVGSEESRMWDG